LCIAAPPAVFLLQISYGHREEKFTLKLSEKWKEVGLYLTFVSFSRLILLSPTEKLISSSEEYTPLPCSVTVKLAPDAPLTVVVAMARTGPHSAQDIETTFFNVYGTCSVDSSLLTITKPSPRALPVSVKLVSPAGTLSFMIISLEAPAERVPTVHLLFVPASGEGEAEVNVTPQG